MTEAAKRLGVTRVALSNLLNGRASLSRQMALRLKTAFGADAEELLGYQEDALRGRRREEERKLTVGSYVPPFLKITASQIHEWADKGDEARSRLPVLLRRLIRSTGDELRRVDFPGFGEAQRHGWDGQVEARRATPWIPEGKSGWELSTRQDSGVKARGLSGASGRFLRVQRERVVGSGRPRIVRRERRDRRCLSGHDDQSDVRS